MVVDALVPQVRKWYLPQELYFQYGWKGWEYSNYAKDNYVRYTDVALEGSRWYDIYGNYITRGWEVYNWTEEQPARYGSRLRKSPQFSNWFDNVLVSRASKGQFYTAVTVGDVIRTTLTPLTFSKPSFNGLQWDFLTDKYGFTLVASRTSWPAQAVGTELAAGTNVTNSSRFLGFRGVAQVGDFLKVGANYVTAHNWRNDYDLSESSLKGVLTEGQNRDYIEKVVIRLSDDSPEDGRGGTVFYGSRIIIDGVEHPEITPSIDGGRLVEGVLRADGPETITLTYDIRRAYETLNLGSHKNLRKIEFILILANDYKVEVTSNLQTDVAGKPVFLTVARARGNVKDGSNQKFVRFMYGLPTGMDIYGVTVEVEDLMGLDLSAEYQINRKFRRFPNASYIEHRLDTDEARAFYVAASQKVYPWFFYGEFFNIDPEYSTSAFISDERGMIDYSNPVEYSFELVDDNDDQDRFPDWNRRNINQRAILAGMEGWDRAVFPGYDENNDMISDFNQNQNLVPDYEEPFLKYATDPPAFLFGLDMNNNGTIDRFENDNLPDYPYKRDHRGYNLYGGLEVLPGVKLTLGYLNEWLLSSDKKSRSTYGLFILNQDHPRIGRIQVMYHPRKVKDNIPDDFIQWVQPPGSRGTMREVSDPLICQDTFIHTAYFQYDYLGLRDLNFTTKLKYEVYRQKVSGMRNQEFFGLINKADYPLRITKRFVLWPKWKSMYQRVFPTDPAQLETKELSEIGFLVGKYSILEKTWLELGVEYTIFNNLLREPTVLPPGFKRDYKGLVLAFQFSNTSDYLGYRFTSNLGFRWERKSYEYGKEIGSTFFVRMFAGAER